jgi:hypothetical protein
LFTPFKAARGKKSERCEEGDALRQAEKHKQVPVGEFRFVENSTERLFIRS